MFAVNAKFLVRSPSLICLPGPSSLTNIRVRPLQNREVEIISIFSDFIFSILLFREKSSEIL